MKNYNYVLLLIVFGISFFNSNLYGQACVPDPQYTAPGIYPDTAIGLASGSQCVPYSEVITLVVPTDTIICTIDSVVLTAVSGLPPGLSYQCEPPFCSMPGGTSGCLLISGTPATIGYYPIVAYTVSYLSGFFCPATNFDTINGYNITINSRLITSAIPVSCFGLCDGVATVSVGGGPTPYTYLWDDPAIQSTASATALCPGNYSVTVTDNVGCVSIDNVTITEPSVLASVSNSTNLSCNGSADGTSSVIVSGGTIPYSYLWSNGAITATVNGLAAGSYIVTITDANGCNVINSIIVTEPSAIVANVGSFDATCGNLDGLAFVSATGGAGSYSYLWDDGNMQTTDTAFGLSAGSYTVTITDNSGCVLIVSTTVNDAGAPTVNLINSNNTTCNSTCDGAATVSATGGTGLLTYTWDTNPIQTGISANNLCAGTFTATVTDSVGCVALLAVTITEPVALIISNESVLDISCNGLSDGSISVLASGGNGGLSFSIDSGITYANTSGNFTGLSAGTYGVSVQDTFGCFITGSVLVLNEPGAIIITAENTSDITCNGNGDGSITISAGGGMGTLSYSIDGGVTYNNSTGNFSGLNAGAYNIAVMDTNSCITSGSQVNINEPGILTGVLSSMSESSAGVSDGTAMII